MPFSRLLLLNELTQPDFELSLLMLFLRLLSISAHASPHFLLTKQKFIHKYYSPKCELNISNNNFYSLA